MTLRKPYFYLVTTGTGDDGDEWHVLGVFDKCELAEAYRDAYQAPRMRADGTSYQYTANIEGWPRNPIYERIHY